MLAAPGVPTVTLAVVLLTAGLYLGNSGALLDQQWSFKPIAGQTCCAGHGLVGRLRVRTLAPPDARQEAPPEDSGCCDEPDSVLPDPSNQPRLATLDSKRR